jgi:DNA-binding XRE family transcriptional regulator
MVTVRTIPRRRVGVDTPTGRTAVRRIRPYRARVVVHPETFADRLRRLRGERGLSLRGLADLAGMAHQSVVDCEHGRDAVTAFTVARLARALRVSMDWLYMGEEAS